MTNQITKSTESKIHEMTNKNARVLGDAVHAALSEVADRFGMLYDHNENGWDASGFGINCTVGFTVRTPDGAPPHFLENCNRYGLQPSDFGRQFQIAGKVYEISSVHTRATKYPVRAKYLGDGLQYKFPASMFFHGVDWTDEAQTEDRAICEIAAEITVLWKNVSHAAAEYLRAMHCLVSIDDAFGCDTGKMVVARFLSNATGWRGDAARRIKNELQSQL